MYVKWWNSAWHMVRAQQMLAIVDDVAAFITGEYEVNQ